MISNNKVSSWHAYHLFLYRLLYKQLFSSHCNAITSQQCNWFNYKHYHYDAGTTATQGYRLHLSIWYSQNYPYRFWKGMSFLGSDHQWLPGWRWFTTSLWEVLSIERVECSFQVKGALVFWNHRHRQSFWTMSLHHMATRCGQLSKK